MRLFADYEFSSRWRLLEMVTQTRVHPWLKVMKHDLGQKALQVFGRLLYLSMMVCGGYSMLP